MLKFLVTNTHYSIYLNMMRRESQTLGKPTFILYLMQNYFFILASDTTTTSTICLNSAECGHIDELPYCMTYNNMESHQLTSEVHSHPVESRVWSKLIVTTKHNEYTKEWYSYNMACNSVAILSSLDHWQTGNHTQGRKDPSEITRFLRHHTAFLMLDMQ